VMTPCGRVVQRPYRSISTREYYRQAGEVRDTVGRASCKTDAGRTVYGGGGVYPDVEFPARGELPAWAAQLNEADIWLEWLGGYLPDEGARLTSLDAFIAGDQLSPTAVASLRELAQRRRIDIPADADPVLRQMLRQVVAGGKWGEAGALTYRARWDAQVQRAVESFGRAGALLGPSK